MPAPQSISVHKLSDAARGTVAKVLEQHKAKIPLPDYRFGFYPPHWWLGIIVRPPDLDKIPLGEAQKLANDTGAKASAEWKSIVGSLAPSGKLSDRRITNDDTSYDWAKPAKRLAIKSCGPFPTS